MPKACDQPSRVSLTRSGNGRYTGVVMGVGNGMEPCALAAAMLSAVGDISGPDVVPLSITTYLLADLREGPCEVAVKWIRGNGNLRYWQAEFRQEFTVASSQILLTSDLPSTSYVPTGSGTASSERGDASIPIDSPFSNMARALSMPPRILMGEECTPCSVAIRFHVDNENCHADSSLAIEYDAVRSSGEVLTTDVRLMSSTGLVAAATYAFLRSAQ